jgi:hypothetical protein
VIESALERATLLLVAVGDKWLSATADHHRRRIDSKDDWVHQEIRYALVSGKPILPVRFDAPASVLDAPALPTELCALADIQSIEIRDGDWEHDLDKVFKRLKDFGFTSSVPIVKYPDPVIKAPVASESVIREFLRPLSGLGRTVPTTSG